MLAIFDTNQDISLAEINIKFTKCSNNTVAIVYSKQVVILFFECGYVHFSLYLFLWEPLLQLGIDHNQYWHLESYVRPSHWMSALKDIFPANLCIKISQNNLNVMSRAAVICFL